jgi:hypothetical protein
MRASYASSKRRRASRAPVTATRGAVTATWALPTPADGSCTRRPADCADSARPAATGRRRDIDRRSPIDEEALIVLVAGTESEGEADGGKQQRSRPDAPERAVQAMGTIGSGTARGAQSELVQDGFSS